jgi:hypothetical protein
LIAVRERCGELALPIRCGPAGRQGPNPNDLQAVLIAELAGPLGEPSQPHVTQREVIELEGHIIEAVVAPLRDAGEVLADQSTVALRHGNPAQALGLEFMVGVL